MREPFSLDIFERLVKYLVESTCVCVQRKLTLLRVILIRKQVLISQPIFHTVDRNPRP